MFRQIREGALEALQLVLDFFLTIGFMLFGPRNGDRKPQEPAPAQWPPEVNPNEG